MTAAHHYDRRQWPSWIDPLILHLSPWVGHVVHLALIEAGKLRRLYDGCSTITGRFSDLRCGSRPNRPSPTRVRGSVRLYTLMDRNSAAEIGSGPCYSLLLLPWPQTFRALLSMEWCSAECWSTAAVSRSRSNTPLHPTLPRTRLSDTSSSINDHHLARSPQIDHISGVLWLRMRGCQSPIFTHKRSTPTP